MKRIQSLHIQRSCKMKTSVPYSLKRIFAGVMLVAVPVFTSCEKAPEPAPNGGNNQPQKHNVELVYGDKPSTNWQHIEMDTIYKYNADTTVDSIFMVPERAEQFSNLSANSMRECANRLRSRHNVNPNKVFGKGDLELKADVVVNNPEIVRFFADTLKYNVKAR